MFEALQRLLDLYKNISKLSKEIMRRKPSHYEIALITERAESHSNATFAHVASPATLNEEVGFTVSEGG